MTDTTIGLGEEKAFARLKGERARSSSDTVPVYATQIQVDRRFDEVNSTIRRMKAKSAWWRRGMLVSGAIALVLFGALLALVVARTANRFTRDDANGLIQIHEARPHEDVATRKEVDRLRQTVHDMELDLAREGKH